MMIKNSMIMIKILIINIKIFIDVDKSFYHHQNFFDDDIKIL